MSIESQTRIKINAQIDQYIRNIDVVVRALASYQCDRDSDPAINAISGLSLSLVLSLELRVFLRVLWFSLSSKANIPKFQKRTTKWMYYLQIVIYLLLLT